MLAADHPIADWTTMMTGVGPDRHGIVTPMRVRRDGMGVHVIGRNDWGAPPVWSLLAAAGHAVAAVNLPGLSPASDWPDMLAVDDRFAAPPLAGDAEWPLQPRCVSPHRLRDALRPLRVHPGLLSEEDCGGLPPLALARSASVHAAAMHLLAAERPDVLIVAHSLAVEAPGQTALRFLDRLLGALWSCAGENVALIVICPGEMVIAHGDGFRADELRHGVQPQDVAATILARFGMKAPSGTPLDDSAPTRPCPAILFEASAVLSEEALPPGAPAIAREVLRAETRALAFACMAAGNIACAADLARAGLAHRPDDGELLLLLGQCQFFLDDFAGCRETGERLARLSPNLPWGAMMQGASLALTGQGEAARPHLVEAWLKSAGNAVALTRLGAIAMRMNDASQARSCYRAAVDVAPDDPDGLAGLGLAQLALGALADGEACLRASLARRFHAPAIHQQLAHLYAVHGEWTKARSSLLIARSQNPDLPPGGAIEDRILEQG